MLIGSCLVLLSHIYLLSKLIATLENLLFAYSITNCETRGWPQSPYTYKWFLYVGWVQKNAMVISHRSYSFRIYMLQTTLGVFFVENYAWSSSIGFETMDALEIRKFVFEFPIWNSWNTFVHVLRTIAIQEQNFLVSYTSRLKREVCNRKKFPSLPLFSDWKINNEPGR